MPTIDGAVLPVKSAFMVTFHEYALAVPALITNPALDGNPALAEYSGAYAVIAAVSFQRASHPDFAVVL
jgi:hypothetical protein